MRSSLSLRACLPFLIILAAACADGPTPAGDAGEEAVAGAPVPAEGTGGLVDFAGNIEAMSPKTVTVDGQEFQVDDQTRVTVDGAEVPFSALHVDDFALVKAKRKNNGTWVARQIRVREDSRATVKLTGRVESADAGDLVVDRRPVRTTAGTFYTGVGDPQSAADVRVGFLVTVTGREEPNRVVEALKVRIVSRQ